VPEIEINGVRLTYTDDGSGPAIIAIHGWGASKRVWRPQIADFSRAHRFIAIDIRGNGESGRPAGAHLYSPAMVAADVRALMDALEIGRAVLLGQSMGTFVSQLLYHDHPQRVRALVLTGAIAGSPPKGHIAGIWVEDIVRDIETNGIKSYLDRNVQYFFAPGADPALIRAATVEACNFDQQAAIAYARSVVGLNIRDRLREIKVPTLIIDGSEDGRTPIEEGEFMNRHIPDCWLKLVKGAGHLVNVEQPATFNRAVMAFIAANA
jgi:pimeloyl-ACP methyl ester carboxylesterase